MEPYDPSAIYWPALCGNRSIYDAFWSNELTINTTNPRLTKCFTHTVLTWVPHGLLVLSLLFYIPYVLQYPVRHRIGTISKLNLAKMIVGSFIIFMSLLSLGDIMSRYSSEIEEEVPNLAAGIYIVVQTIGLLIAEVLTYWIYRRGLHTSGVLFIYWLALVLTCILRVASDLMEGPRHIPGTSELAYTLFYVYSGLVVVQFFLNIPADVTALRKNPCPKNSANFLSLIFYTWFMPMVVTGYKRTLQYTDIWDIRDQDSSKTNLTKFIKDWEEELLKNGYQRDSKGNLQMGEKRLGKPSLMRVMVKSVGRDYSYGGMITLVWSLVELVNPQILNLLIAFIEGGDRFVWHGYLMAVSMFLMSMISVLLLHNGLDFCYNVGMRLRTITIGAIYRKATKLSSCGRLGSKSAGEITNMMSVDAQKMQDTLLFANQLWISPLIISLGTYLLWQKMGSASLAGLAVYAFLIPGIAIITSKFMRSFQITQMKLKDSRIKLMNQILNGIKVLKLYAWESFFEDRIQRIRKEEMTYLKRGSFISTANMTVSYSASFIASLFMFLTYIFTTGDGILPPDVAFVSLALMNSLSFSIIIIPPAVMNIIQGMVSLRRIQDFLLAEEIDTSCVTHEYNEDGPVEIKNGTFSWGTERTILKNINILVPDGKLVAVVGHVGSGKSSIISAILGEMIRESGSVNVDGRVAYVPQQAWIQNLTVRDNILFSETYARAKYNEVLDACALTEDLKILAGGDMTEIGERGINLSGGQKQRVSLARAVYQNSDIYLLDDPLSAVDAHVGKHIFDNVIGPNGWLRNKTRVLVTNAVTFLPKTDHIIVLKEGEVTEQGTFDELIERQGAFSEFVATYLKEVEEELDEDDEALRRSFSRTSSISYSSDSVSSLGSEGPGSNRASLRKSKKDEDAALLRRLSSMMEASGERRISTGKKTSEQRRKSSARRMSTMRALEEDQKKKANTLIIEETAEEGSIQLKVLKRYVKAARMRWALVVIFGSICMIGGTVGSNIWLSDWSNDSFLDAETAAAKVSLRLGIYGTLGATTVIGITLLMLGVIYGTVAASTTMHNDLLNNVLKSPMSFFDTTPLGRLINRFSKDIDTMDVELRMYIQSWISQFSPIIATVIIISYSTPIFVVVVIPLVILFSILQRVYVKTARQIKRIDSIKRSPVYNNFSETLNGVSSIRAYGQQDRFIKHADQLLDNNQKVWFAVYCSNRWIGVLSQNIGNMVVLFAALFCVIARETIDPGTVGMSLTFAMQVGIQIVMVLRTTCELETYIVSVERVSEYTETPREAPWEIPGRAPPANWPSSGMVKFDEYCTRYREGLDLVLKGVNCFIRPGEKIGVVGRTGAGKSSMTLALFRIIESSGGAIYIDDVNIASLGLHDIRSKLTIIPQDPMVFSGTLRFNVDPAEAFDEAEVWKALEQAHLSKFVGSLSAGLDYECGEEGANLSVGQRQLVCLARALLRRTKILILDEATAAVDLETDDLIQNTIRTAFKDCTVITIAHRLNTILDTDRVMVLDKGKVEEFDSPNNLLENEEAIFHKMAKDAGLI